MLIRIAGLKRTLEKLRNVACLSVALEWLRLEVLRSRIWKGELLVQGVDADAV